MTIYTVMLFVVFAVAGLDAGRFGWSVMPIALQVVGFVGSGVCDGGDLLGYGDQSFPVDRRPHSG